MTAASFYAQMPEPAPSRRMRRQRLHRILARIDDTAFTDHSRPGCCQGVSVQADPLSRPAQPDASSASGTNFHP